MFSTYVYPHYYDYYETVDYCNYIEGVAIYVILYENSGQRFIDLCPLPGFSYLSSGHLIPHVIYTARCPGGFFGTIILEALNGYKDADEKIVSCQSAINDAHYNVAVYTTAVELMNSGDYEAAITSFMKLNGYKDSQELIEECQSHIGTTSTAGGNNISSSEVTATNDESDPYDGLGKLDFFIQHNDDRDFDDNYFDGFTKEEADLARNGCYATWGRGFTTKSYQDYYSSHFSWYVVIYQPDEWDDSIMNGYSARNLVRVITYEQSQGWM